MKILVGVAGFSSFFGTLVSLISIWLHLKNYTRPRWQRCVVRILWMCPVYAITSWLSLISLEAAYYLDTVRDVYEAFVIYSFFDLLVYFLGGERNLLISSHEKNLTPHYWPLNHILPDFDIGDPYSFLFLKRGILQFVFVKPLLATFTMLLKSTNTYDDGNFSLTSGYLWISLLYNISVSLSLHCLVMFFMCTKDDLEPYR